MHQEAAKEALLRYDCNASGYLELGEIRALLVDLGLFPGTQEEKAVVRMALLHHSVQVPDDSQKLVRLAREDSEDSKAVERAAQSRITAARSHFSTIEEERDAESQVARGARLTLATIGPFVEQVRRGLTFCRESEILELFSHHDVLKQGVLDIKIVFEILADRNLLPKAWQEQKFLCECLLTDEEMEIQSRRSFRGFEHFQTEYPDMVLNSVEFFHVLSFLQQAHDQVSSERDWRLAKQYGVTDMHIFASMRQEIHVLRTAINQYDSGTGLYDRNEVWVVLHSLGMIPPEHNKAKILRNILGACERGSLKESHLSGLTLLAARSVPGWEEQERAQMSFQEFLFLVAKVRNTISKDDSRDLWPAFSRHHRLNLSGTTSLDVGGTFKALNDLGLGPKSKEDQKNLRALLDHANEFGFEPMALDFQSFVSFVQRVREQATQTRIRNHNRVAAQTYQLTDNQINEFRTAFDALDEKQTGHLVPSQLRRFYQTFGWPQQSWRRKTARPSRNPHNDESEQVLHSFDDVLRYASKHFEEVRRAELLAQKMAMMRQGPVDEELQFGLQRFVMQQERRERF
jgi:Ca2+-binding EF-hand superfamily protein